jgi:hypothetical protein
VNRDDLLRALKAELAGETPDVERVGELSDQLMRANPDVARFSVDAGMIARLGRELVQRHDTALSELVKNGYDADAKSVAVHIARQGYGEFIEIRDDGSGMSREELALGFLRLATTRKVNEPLSPRFKRRRAGKKGVGRFAAERLGHRLILTTATVASELALQMDINWDHFLSGKDLYRVSVPISQVPKTFPEGTLLRIEKLRDNWPTAAVERTFRQIVHLIDPGDQTGKSGTGSDFSVSFHIDGRSTSIVDLRTEVASYAFATILTCLLSSDHGELETGPLVG